MFFWGHQVQQFHFASLKPSCLKLPKQQHLAEPLGKANICRTFKELAFLTHNYFVQRGVEGVKIKT